MQKKLVEQVMILKNCILMIRIFFSMCIFFLCSAFGYREPVYCKIVDVITKSYLKEFIQPRRLMLSGYGGAMMNDIQEISLSFLCFDTLTIDEARVLYVEMMEEYLKRINCHKKIRPYLHNYPFLESNIKLMIGFEDSQRKIISDGHVALMSIAKNHMVYFAAYDSVKQEFYTLHEEPYEEAFRIVKNRKGSLPWD